MTRFRSFLAVVLFAPAWVWCATLHITPKDTNYVTRCGVKTIFTVRALDDKGSLLTTGTVHLVIDNFGPQKQLDQTYNLARANPFQVEGTLHEPGFLRVHASGLAKCPPKDVSVAYEPTKIQKGSPSPDDFDAFWQEARAKLAREVPLDAQVVPVPEKSTKAWTYFRISFATYGRRVHGYMSVPTNKKRAPYPVSVSVAPAGFGDWSNQMGGSDAFINVFFGVYPFPPHWDWKKLGLKEKWNTPLNAQAQAESGTRYCQHGLWKSREDYFYYPVILGLDRAVDWLAARSDVDKKHFTYQGTSQGGGFGFYLTGLNHHFTKAVFYVPAITDTMGFLKKRQSGWPQITEAYASASIDRQNAVARHAPYFDGANFASRIQCPVRVAVGFSDTVCAPCAVYAAYNEIRVKDKAIIHGIDMTHGCYSSIYAQLGAWLHQNE